MTWDTHGYTAGTAGHRALRAVHEHGRANDLGALEATLRSLGADGDSEAATVVYAWYAAEAAKQELQWYANLAAEQQQQRRAA